LEATNATVSPYFMVSVAIPIDLHISGKEGVGHQLSLALPNIAAAAFLHICIKQFARQVLS
jgi:hypothetical protein